MNLIINTHSISQHNGLFSLNDLHKASGSENKHKPSYFMANQETQELISEIESENQIAYHTIKGGNTKTIKQGTYACRELVYRYAMWISPKFSLMVIRAFDALNTGAIPCLPKLSSDDTLPLRNAVNMATGVLKLDYATIYKMVHQRFGIDEIKELSREQIEQAVEYVHHLMIQSGQVVQDFELYEILSNSATSLVCHNRLLKKLKMLPFADEAVLKTEHESNNRTLTAIAKYAHNHNLKNRFGTPLFTQGRINWSNGGALIV